MIGPWIVACTLGLGIGLPLSTLWSLLVLPAELPTEPGAVLLVGVLGAVGGALSLGVLGAVQAVALRQTWPSLSFGRWTVMTALAGFGGGLVTFLIARTLVPLMAAAEFPFLTLVRAVAIGLATGLLVGLAQRPVLRSVGAEAGSWVKASAYAWTFALVVGSVRGLFGGSFDAWVLLLLGSTVAGLAQGAVLGLATGGALQRSEPDAE